MFVLYTTEYNGRLRAAEIQPVDVLGMLVRSGVLAVSGKLVCSGVLVFSVVKFFSKLNYFIFGYFDRINIFFDSKNNLFLG